jgi:hypothetical protein
VTWLADVSALGMLVVAVLGASWKLASMISHLHGTTQTVCKEVVEIKSDLRTNTAQTTELRLSMAEVKTRLEGLKVGQAVARADSGH